MTPLVNRLPSVKESGLAIQFLYGLRPLCVYYVCLWGLCEHTFRQ